MADDGPSPRTNASPTRLFLAFGVPIVLGVIAGTVPWLMALHPAIPVLFIAAAALFPVSLFYSQRRHARTVEDGIRQLIRGDL